jgi:uncharacterized protein (DUF362 family)
MLVKPSIIAPAYPYQAVNTNPELLDALLKILFEFEIKKENIIVAEQSLTGDVFESAAKAGIIDVCRKNEVKFVDISNGPFEEIDGYAFKIFKEALNRKIINVPIMKTNSEIGISGAMENLSRLLEEHDELFGNLAKTLDVFTIADATKGMEGQGPLNGEPAFLNLVFAGRNPSFIDAVFCEAFMISFPKHFEKNTEEIEIVVDELNALKRKLKAPAEKAEKRKELFSKV